MEGVRTLVALALFAFALWNVRVAATHARNLIGYRRRVNDSVDAIEQGELPPYPLALAAHLERVTDKGPAAIEERVRWDWVGMAVFGLLVAITLAGLGIWLLP